MGYWDTSNFTQSVSLYNQEQVPGLPDVEYPRKLVQTKELYVSASKANGGSADYYGYGDTVAKNFTLYRRIRLHHFGIVKH